jgi:hypothetical protein
MSGAVIENALTSGDAARLERPDSRLAPAIGILVAIAIAGWAVLDPRFRDAEGYASGRMCLPLSGAIAALSWAWAVRSGAARFGAWLALAIVGQASSLAMIDAGPNLRWQHYWPIPRLASQAGWVPLALVALQALFVLVSLRPHVPAIRRWIAGVLKPWQQVVLALAFVLTSATLSRQISIYLSELILATFVQLVQLGTIGRMVWAIPTPVLGRWKARWLRTVGASGDDAGTRPDRIVLAAAVGAVALAVLVGATVYERHPHIPDEVVYLYHARYMAEGMLTMPAPPSRQAFDLDLMTFDSDRWFCPVPPGWPMILTVGAYLGQPWLVNPVLAGLNILLAFMLVRQLYDRRTARLAALMVAVSPWALFLNMSLMPHTWTMTCALVGAYAMARTIRAGGGVGWPMLAGVATGVITLIRPLEAMAMAMLLGLWSLSVRGVRAKAISAGVFTLGTAAVALLNLPYNLLLTGSMTSFPLMAYSDRYYGKNVNMLGFGANRGLGWSGLDPFPGHGLIDVLVNANLNLFSINTDLWGWSTGSILLVAFLVFKGSRRRSDWLMIGTIGTIIGLHSFYWFSGGPDFGARYWYLVLLPAAVLTVRGAELLMGTLERRDGFSEADRTRIGVAVVALSLLAMVNFVPWRALDKYHHFRGMRGDIPELAETHHFGRSLVLVRGTRDTDYPSAANYNPVDLQASVPIYAWDRNRQARIEALRAYPDRPVWIVDGPTLTGGPFRIVEGPVPAADLLAREEPGGRP